MKKTLVTLLGAVLAIAIYWLGFANGVYYEQNKAETETETEITTISLSDEEIMHKYIVEEFGEGYYGKLKTYDDTLVNNIYVMFVVYDDDGNYVDVISVFRHLYQNVPVIE